MKILIKKAIVALAEFLLDFLDWYLGVNQRKRNKRV
jgi:hypothetical protein